ncbi:MAG: tetratricopeptide repeat protein, partial [candidate division Zixibacteria bacterium]|nr:tetratricopeptide repeat protein [candidate division Zixibacteria bacterium]
VELLRKDFEAIVHDRKYAPSAYYNLANGYYALFHFKKKKNRYVACFKESELDKAKFYYRKALEYNLQDPELTSQVWVNLGNSFDHLGRVIEAVECYEEALKHKPDHGMALGNKGIALFNYARLTGEHQGTFLVEAYSLLFQASKVGVSPEAANVFTKYLEAIRKQFPDTQIIDNPPKYPGYTIKARSKFEMFLIEFCLKNKLYLNICNYCQKCDAAIGDPVAIQKMIVPINEGSERDFLKDDPFMRLSAYLNQIKQDYVTGRFLLILSKYEGLNLNFVDKRVKIIDTLDYSMHNIYIQLVKASFKNFYDILDKIACFVNDYLELGIPERKIDFQRVWYSNWNTKTIFSKIVNTKNFSLNALFDMHRDFDRGPHKKLRKIRNALTHRFINVRMFQELEDEESMREDTLVKQTLELARLVRSAIIYLLYFVQGEESKKEVKTKGISAPMFAQEFPDNLKSYR